jgi:putative transposase
VEGGEVELSAIGRIAEEHRKEIPQHFKRVRLDNFRIMLNHIHGVLIIQEHCGERACPVPPEEEPVSGNSLSDIIGSFKSAVSKGVHDVGYYNGPTIWQSRFYDHIVRSDVELYFIRQHIELNPLMWEHDIRNPNASGITRREFEEIPKCKLNIIGEALAMIMCSKIMLSIKWVD